MDVFVHWHNGSLSYRSYSNQVAPAKRWSLGRLARRPKGAKLVLVRPWQAFRV